jgi:hypothetical protein
MARPRGSDFLERMKLLGDAIEAGVEQLQAHAMDSVQTHIIEVTPVSPETSGHSGRARNNWIVTQNHPTSRADYLGPFEASGRTRIEENRMVIAANTRMRPLHLTNNLDYIAGLNKGDSSQAPAGFIQTALLVGIRAVNKATLMSYIRVNWKRGKGMGRLMVHSSGR